MIRFGLVLGLGLSLVATTASADSGTPDNIPGISATTPGITPEGALAPISVVEGAGFKVGEGTVLHPIVGLETGVISNVFNETSAEGPKSAGILRLIAQIGTGSLSPQRLAVTAEGVNGGSPETSGPTANGNLGSLQYRADLRLSYDLYLSGNENLQAQNGLGIGGLFRGTVFPQRTWSFLYLENFQRVIRSTNFESRDQTNRDVNRVQLGLQFAPGGRAITGLLHYENVIDFFESSDQQFANRIQHSAGLTASWRFRPMTVFFADATMGYFSGLGGASTKVDSFPLTVSAGAQTLLTLNTSLIAHVGYTNGFYANNTASFSSILGGLQAGYRYAHTGRVTAMYDYSHQDSINANFFRDHLVRVEIEQQFVPFVVHVAPEIRFRRYEGVTSVIGAAGMDVRDDIIVSVSAGARYNFRDWFAGVVEYRLNAVQTNFTYMSGNVLDDPSYVRHELIAGVRAAL